MYTDVLICINHILIPMQRVVWMRTASKMSLVEKMHVVLQDGSRCVLIVSNCSYGIPAIFMALGRNPKVDAILQLGAKYPP